MKSFFSSFTILILVSNFSFSQYKWELGFSSGAGITKNRMLTFPENSSIRSSFSSNLKARYNCAKHFYVSGSLMYVLQGNNYQGWFLGASNEDLFSSQDYIHRRRQDYILMDISPGVQFGEKTGLNLEIGVYGGRLMNAEGKLISKETPSTVLVRENETEDYSTKDDFGLKSRIAS
ncbi:MAG: hypothetical protein MI810_00625 [Flavobacteriales bacterium]|nr:hypothetical protein [Flavobacteriales bacterium]